MIQAIDLKKQFKERAALKGVSFRVGAGEIFAYLGPNGAGKTTTIRILTGLSRPSSGQALVDGLNPLSPSARLKAGVVAQSINLDHELSVAENLEIHARLFGMEPDRRASRAKEVMLALDIADRACETVSKLSGGLKRRVMIARALMHEPCALFLDEPTVGLDAEIRRSLWAAIRQLKRQGAAIFLTTHYIEEAEALADRVAFLRKGEIIDLREPKQMLAELGEWALADYSESGRTRFFASREDALASLSGLEGEIVLRRTTLEDAYLRAMQPRKPEEAD